MLVFFVSIFQVGVGAVLHKIQIIFTASASQFSGTAVVLAWERSATFVYAQREE